jgi:transcriptional regulator with GAF, ATPase, and Fis domain/tetratricopeptide (TPR) repeat protein/tRNA A37 threonylcarbamoyladenosine biosynthesis protein TsaE
MQTSLAAEVLLAGRYAHVAELGRGASGRVILVEDRVGGGTRAVKLVSADDAERLRWELTLLASLSHPGLARVHELVTVREPVGPPFRLEPGAAALVEEHVEGESAAERVAALASDEERARFAVEVGLAVARALGAIHAAGLVHGDVKPSNVVVPADASAARLVDLGLARAPGVSATVSGTPAFLAPEAWLGERSVGTDLYALGVTLHALCHGRSALDTESSRATRAPALLRPAAVDVPAAVPLSLRRLIGDLLAPRPSERPASAREVALRLAALAADVGLAVPEALQVSEQPSPRERAARVALVPLVGRSAELAELIARLREPGVVVVLGPPGAGRSRLVREAVRARQDEAVERGAVVPTYVVAHDARIPRIRHDAIVHLEGGRLDHQACVAAVEAAAVVGVGLVVVVEPAEGEHDDAVRVGPLEDAELRGLLAEVLSIEPAPSLVAAARAVSGGLPGRLCRRIAEGLEAGLDPTRAATLAELGRHAREHADVPEHARALAELLATAGGALDAEAAARVCPEAAEQARSLRALGLAYEQHGRIVLRADVGAALARTMSEERRRELAERALEVPLDAVAEAHVRAARGEHDAAEHAFERAMEAARRAGEPERAAALGEAALRLFASPRLRVATADALRARAREREALALLEGVEDAAALRAELHRLLGQLEQARAQASSALGGDGLGEVVLALVALTEGDADEAIRRASSLGDAAPLVDARRWEVIARAELLRGRLDAAEDAVARALAQARRSGARGVEARAVAVEGMLRAARGEVAEAAACHERAFALADAAGERHAAASFLVNVGLGRLERGEAGPAIEALREAARRLTELERRREATRALYNLGNAAALIGDDDLARSTIRRASTWAAELGDGAAQALAAVVEAELALRSGKLETAERTLEAAWRVAAPDVVRATVGARLALVRAVAGRLEAAREALDEAEALSSGAEVSIARVRLDLAADESEAAARAAERVLEETSSLGWESRLRAALVAAEAFERAGRGADSAVALARARALLDGAASTLSAPARARLRAVPAYRRALGAIPSGGLSADGGRWRALASHGKRLVRETRLGALHERLVDAAVELVDAERGFLVARGTDGGLRVLCARAFGAPLEGERPSESVVTRVLDGGRALVAVDALHDERLDRAASVHAMALRSVLGVPIPLRGGRAMALVVDDRLRPGAFDELATALLVDLAELAGGAIEGAEALQRERREGRRLLRERTRLSAQVESQERELRELRRSTDRPAFAELVAESEVMRRAVRMASRVAASEVPVLVRGESGTGKELVARGIHDASARREGPYVSENVSAIPDTLLESALFGHARGAFTGAERARRGLFEIADGGTLFLDEVGEMSEPMQAKLLRVLQDGELRPIGSERARKVDVRVVAATHRDLERMVEEGRFREDLFYRLAVVQIELPPLRERPEDVGPLVAAFLERHAEGRRVRVDRGAMAALRAYAWPGNVRQLENEVRRALVLAEDVIGIEHLSPLVRGDEARADIDELDLKAQIESLERRLIRAALDRTEGNQTRAAELLGVSRFGLAKMMKRLALGTPS